MPLQNRPITFARQWVLVLLMGALLAATVPVAAAPGPPASGVPVPAAPDAGTDWPQLGHDPQRSNTTSAQVDPPYCYTWKWYEVPIASRAQPVVAGGRLFIGSMDGVLYARDASTGAPLWSFPSQGPIRNSAGVLNDTVVFSSHDGYTYALDAASGAFKWKTLTGASSTAPLMDAARGRVYVGSSNGKLTALNITTGGVVWDYDSGAPILTSPALSVDGQTIFFGNENIQAIAVTASSGAQAWRTTLQGQSLADRYPVVTADSVTYRSQPLYFFHVLLHEGDSTMDQAGAVNSDWATDWSNVKPQIINYLSAQPSKQTFFVLNASTGITRGVAPVLYTYGNNDIPNVPVVSGNNVYVTYRARHGIQTDGGAVHVTSKYDAELGQMNLSTLDITGLRSSGSPYANQFRMTSDEPAMLSMGGNILWVDNWERLGGVNVSTGQLVHVGAVSNDWPECGAQCGPGSDNPFFPLSGSGAAYPFPSPRVTEGHQRGGVVIANNMLYWRVIEGGLAGISHRAAGSCPAPLIYTHTGVSGQPSAGNQPSSFVPRNGPLSVDATRPLTDYVSLDLTTPVANPPEDLINRLRDEVRALVTANGHLMPFYIERGFTTSFLWPYDVPSGKTGLPSVSYGSQGNVYWQDPGELLYAMALAYPYLDVALQTQVKTYMAAEMNRYPPLQDSLGCCLAPDWLAKGTAREGYTVPFRNQLNSWPPSAASMSNLYALWLWSKNTGDWSYAQSHWNEATSLFNARRGNMTDYYSDIAGAMGYARMAQHFGNASAYDAGTQAAVGAMQAGKNITTYIDHARNQYLDPRDQPTGWYLPVFFGMTPEVGLYLREQTNGGAQSYLASREEGDGLRWWYLTRAGAHAEVGETSYVAPNAAWAHFLAHAYVAGDKQETLREWLDRPWARGDLYSIQKVVATLHAPQTAPDFSASAITASSSTPQHGEVITFTITIRNQGRPLTDTLYLTNVVPIGLDYVPGSLTTATGEQDDSDDPMLCWEGELEDGTSAVTLRYTAVVTETTPRRITNTVRIDAGSAGGLDLSAAIVTNGYTVFLPLVLRGAGS